jgi:hypothetical protein
MLRCPKSLVLATYKASVRDSDLSEPHQTPRLSSWCLFLAANSIVHQLLTSDANPKLRTCIPLIEIEYHSQWRILTQQTMPPSPDVEVKLIFVRRHAFT